MKDIPTKTNYEEIHYSIRLNAEPNRVCCVDEYILTDEESNITINKSIMGYTSKLS